MIQKIVKKYRIDDILSARDDLAYWLSKALEDRVSAIAYLRRQHHGNTARLQRSARIIQLSQS